MKKRIASVRYADGSRSEMQIIGDDIQSVRLSKEAVQIFITDSFCQLDKPPRIIKRFVIGIKYPVKQLRKRFKNDINKIEQLKDLPENSYMALCSNDIILELNKKDIIINPDNIVNGYYREPEGIKR